jgi:cyclic beta-1,2-glucan synthetase
MPSAAETDPAIPAAAGKTATSIPADGAELKVAARALANEHAAVDRSNDRRGHTFLQQRDLDQLERGFSRARQQISRHRLDAPEARKAAEWLLDNDYLVRRVLRQLRREMPPGFQRRLPRLRGRNQPRVLALAEVLYDDTPDDIDQDRLVVFLREYQRAAPLTIAELWALPVLIRWVVLRRFRDVVDYATGDPRVSSLPAARGDAGSAAGHAVRALRLLAEIDWQEAFCRLSATEITLSEDPIAAYPRMDFATRDAYRRAVEEVALAADRTEVEVSRAVLDRARAAAPASRAAHVGHWLLGPGRPELERRLRAQPRGVERYLRAHPRLTFFGLHALSQLSLLGLAVAYLLWVRASVPVITVAVLLLWIPTAVPAAELVQWLLARWLVPRPLPKLDFSDGIPERWQTLVAVPTLLGDHDNVEPLIAQLEIHYLANPDPQLRFALLTDFVDSSAPPDATSEATLARAAQAIRALNKRHAGRPFHLLHREPRWNPRERRWMGWERKRGKLDELNRLLRGATDTSYALHIGDRSQLEHIAFVLTLDSDTELPPGAATRLVGALAHPLNRPAASDGGRIDLGYTVIQPRVEIAPRSASRSLFARLFSGDIGIDIYSRTVSEVYQDLFGEGIYVGKGIYDVDGFRASLDGRVPENALVSHDLFEGIHGRAALATDIVLYEDHPPHYLAYLDRMHRWVRGDWQLVPWLVWRVPHPDGGRIRTRLRWLDRFKIADNLRRSLLAPALLALLMAGWLLLPGHPLVWTLAALLAPGAAALWPLVSAAMLPRRELGRWFFAVCFTPQEAYVVVDAVTRALVRTLLTRQRMLEWTTAAHAARMSAGQGRRGYWRRLWMGPATAVLLAGAIAAVALPVLPWAGPVLLLWAASPEFAWRISQPAARHREVLDPAGARFLRRVARRTWLFFETFVGPDDRWLPPDHVQEDPRAVVAHRTSPTNIGMLLLSQLAAYDLGYLGPAEFASWAANTLDTVEQLERHRGQVYNWYDTRTLTPLAPRYVSSVDSGNLAGALLVLAAGCEQVPRDPPLRAAATQGLLDTASLLSGAIARWAAETAGGPPAVSLELARKLVRRLEQTAGPLDRAELAGAAADLAAVDAQLLDGLHQGFAVSHDPVLLRELRIWLERMGHQLAEARRESDLLAPGDLLAQQPAIEDIAEVCRRAQPSAASTARRRELLSASEQAAALCDRLRKLAQRARRIAHAMDFRFLYDEQRRLFHVGYNVDRERFDPHHYDLLASEARLTSYLAITWRQVPIKHWFSLGRPLIRVGRSSRALMSWGGSMFEYLMPRLLMRSHDDTLLYQSCQAAVSRQIAYGRKRNTPWGISESGYALLDGQQNYQYRAFGVPGLGMRRDLEQDLVVAPYASMLALPYRPKAVVANLERLVELGMLGRFGLYEAADYDRQRAPGGRPPALVRSYMAHHHGMSLAAIANCLLGDIMVDRFHRDPAVQSSALLLDERVPAAAPVEAPAAERPEPIIEAVAEGAVAPAPRLAGWQPYPHAIQVWALSNGNLTSLVTTDGGGGLRWRNLLATRWEPDPVCDAQGSWIYLRDHDSGEIFSATPGPTGDWPADAQIRCEVGWIEFHRRHRELAIKTRIAVVPGQDVELREIEIANHGDERRNVRIVGCIEPVLQAEAEAIRHPAFSRLFLRCWPVHELAGALISRTGRGDQPAPIMLFRMTGDPPMAPRLLEIDRERFVGRHGSLRLPSALVAAPDAPAEHTLDPLCACAVDLSLAPGSGSSVTLITALAATREEVLALAHRFGSSRAVRWSFEDAARAAARQVVDLGLSPNLLPAAQRVLSGLLVPDPDLRAPEDMLEVGRPSQRDLWGRGISGDEPILLVQMRRGTNEGFLREVLAIYRYLRARGVRADLVLIENEPSSYSEQGADVVQELLGEHGATGLLHQRGGIHVIRADQSRPHQLTDLAGAALVYLDSGRGSITDQLAQRGGPPAALPAFVAAGVPPGVGPDPELSLAVPTLSRDNGFGGLAGAEYIVRPDAVPPAPWCNVIVNQDLGCLVSEAGLGSTWALNASENRLTPWRNDPVADTPSEALYLRDEETGRLWTTTALPAGGPTLVRHGQGYTSYQQVCAAVEHTMTVFMHPDEPAKIVWLRVRNASSRHRRLTATYYAEWVLGGHRQQTRAYIMPELSAAACCLLATTSWPVEFAGRAAFLASNHDLHGCTSDRLEMLGRGGDLSAPQALRRWGLSGRIAPGRDPCAALQVHLDLAPGQEMDVSFFVGQAGDRGAAIDTVRRLREPGAVARAWTANRAFWQQLVGAVQVHTPDDALDELCNRWLLYQTLASRFFGRAGFYQSSGAFGFRDQLQDSLALIHCAPHLMRSHLLDAAARQFVEGDVLHWWHPPGGAGVRTRCSDDLLWLVYATAEYVAATGDVAILAEQVPFLLGEPLAPHEDVHYGHVPAGPPASLLEHCRRALVRGFTSGPHGLPLIGDGDWNDGMNHVGQRGRGESIWLGWFVYTCTERFADLLDRIGEQAEAQRWRDRLPPLTDALATHGWDGSWYRRAYHDDGRPIGSARGAPPHIDSIAQSWAVLSGAGQSDQIEQALAAAERMLVRADERLVLLLTPPFGARGPDPGYIASYPAGIRENGGQYTHAAAWLGWAHAARGDGDAAHRIFALLNPLERTTTPGDVERYRVEPYVLAADVCGQEPWTGRGGWTWYTGAAGWTWRLVVEALLGLRRRNGTLEVAPCIPAHWPGFEASVRAGPLTVHVVVHNRDVWHRGAVAEVQLDGQAVGRAVVDLRGAGTRRLELWLEEASPSSTPRDSGEPPSPDPQQSPADRV